jgi:RNA polymerase sigma-70 factor (ECF subfamily)
MHNQQTFINSIAQNQGLIYKVAKVYTNNREDEQDLYQEIVYQLYKSFGNFKGGSKISTWMYRIALNTAIAYLHTGKNKRSHIPFNEELLNIPAITDTVRQQQFEAMYAAIAALSTIEKAIILLYLDDKTYDEIAAITGFTVTNVGTRLGRIKQKLINQLKNK